MICCLILTSSSLFANVVPDPTAISLEYLEICRACPEDSIKLDIIQQHIKHFFDLKWYEVQFILIDGTALVRPSSSRRTWITKFHRALANCKDLEEIDRLLRLKVQRWRGKPLIFQQEDAESGSESEVADDRDVDLGETYLAF